jgi:hypothetical protein
MTGVVLLLPVVQSTARTGPDCANANRNAMLADVERNSLRLRIDAPFFFATATTLQSIAVQ